MAADVVDPRPPGPPKGTEPVTRDRNGRHLVGRDEERRQEALHISALTFQSAQGLDSNTTKRIIERAQAFEDYIAGG